MSKVKASHLLVKTEQEAIELAKEIADGADFSEVASRVSLCPSSRNGGDLGFFSQGQMVKEFDEAVFSMEVGEISAPVQTQFGWHLIKLTDKKD